MFHFVCNKSGGDESLTGCIKLQGWEERTFHNMLIFGGKPVQELTASARSLFSHKGARIEKTRDAAPSHFKPSHSNMQYCHCGKYQRTHKTKLQTWQDGDCSEESNFRQFPKNDD